MANSEPLLRHEILAYLAELLDEPQAPEPVLLADAVSA
jgi:hypothetical protein